MRSVTSHLANASATEGMHTAIEDSGRVGLRVGFVAVCTAGIVHLTAGNNFKRIDFKTPYYSCIRSTSRPNLDASAANVANPAHQDQ